MENYIIIQSPDAVTLVEEVNKFLNLYPTYQLQGGAISDGKTFSQTLIGDGNKLQLLTD